MAFKQVRLGDYYKFEKGLGYKGEFLAEESDVALIGMDSHDEGGGYKENSEKFYTGPYKPENVAEVGDVIFAGTEQGFGLLASPLMVPESDRFSTYLFSGDVLKAIPLKPDEFSAEYLYNIYRVEIFRTKAAYGDSGTTVRRISNENMGEQVVPLPDISTQLAINEIISLVDQQIANNKALSKNLEALAQSIFKSWFIDFDPVHAKKNGEKPFGMDPETTNLFPDVFVESELGVIPSGWSLKTISEVSETLLGGTPSRKKEEYWNGSIAWVNSGKVNNFRITSPSERITNLGLSKSATKLLPKGTTVIAITGATLGQFSRLEIDSCANQSVVGIVSSDSISNEFIYLTIKNNINRLIEAQTGGAQQHINKEDVNEFLFLYPGVDLVEKFTSQVEPLFNQISVILLNNENLELLLQKILLELINNPELISDLRDTA